VAVHEYVVLVLRVAVPLGSLYALIRNLESVVRAVSLLVAVITAIVTAARHERSRVCQGIVEALTDAGGSGRSIRGRRDGDPAPLDGPDVRGRELPRWTRIRRRIAKTLKRDRESDRNATTP
jgi:hypothetical protein